MEVEVDNESIINANHKPRCYNEPTKPKDIV